MLNLYCNEFIHPNNYLLILKKYNFDINQIKKIYDETKIFSLKVLEFYDIEFCLKYFSKYLNFLNNNERNQLRNKIGVYNFINLYMYFKKYSFAYINMTYLS